MIFVRHFILSYAIKLHEEVITDRFMLVDVANGIGEHWGNG